MSVLKNMENYISAREVYKQKKFYWVKSYLTVLKYIKEYRAFLKPATRGKKSGKRYYVKPTQIKKLVKMFEMGLLR
jgi:ribosomal protein S8